MRRHIPARPETASAAAPLPNLAARAPIASIMTRQVVLVRRDASVESVTALFLERGLHGAPVVGDQGEIVGFVSLADLVRERYDHGDAEERVPLRVPTRNGGGYWLGSGFHAESPTPPRVADLMMPSAVTLEESTAISTAAALMATEHLHRIPVVDGQGTLVGILSSLDVLRWLARSDGYLVPDRAPPARDRGNPT